MIVLPKKKATYKKHTRLKGDFETGKVFVLQNENSASASEILAGSDSR
jgi:carboxyl-terminal processing protease